MNLIGNFATYFEICQVKAYPWFKADVDVGIYADFCIHFVLKVFKTIWMKIKHVPEKFFLK